MYQTPFEKAKKTESLENIYFKGSKKTVKFVY